MDSNYWTDETILKLRSLLLKKWESLGEDDGAFGKWLFEQKIFVMGLTDVRKSWNMDDRRRICIENPTFADMDEVVDVIENRNMPESYKNSPVRKIALEETWFLVPEDFAKKALVLGLP